MGMEKERPGRAETRGVYMTAGIRFRCQVYRHRYLHARGVQKCVEKKNRTKNLTIIPKGGRIVKRKPPGQKHAVSALLISATRISPVM